MPLKPIILPQEVWDNVISHLQYDGQSLKSCCIVCKAWALPSRTHLFRKLVFTASSPSRLSALFSNDSILPIPTWAVKEVEYRDAPSPTFLVKQLLYRFSSCLAKLHLHDVIFEAFSCVVDMICAFPTLKTLWLRNVSWTRQIRKECIDMQKKGLPHSLTDFRLHGINFRVFFIWILAHPSLPYISDLDFGPLDEEAIPYAGRYMLVVGPHVKHLSLSFGFSETWHLCIQDLLSENEQEMAKYRVERPLDSIAYNYGKKYGIAPCDNLAAFNNLQSLRINEFLDSSSINHSTATFWAPRLLASIQPRRLEHIIFCLNLSSVGELDNVVIDWDFIDLALTSGLYASLRCLLFEVGGQVNLDGLANLVMSRLPMTRSRGILRFSRPAC
ncbi:hypothetical protein CVT26_012436 [Gymnopilus dilepis]|uniref:F-box domain-containing protein n=1 Tax=Gymnopilus dilepis TaxID=231916 RepID=A0A409YW62_9AGAR|nr:hypothetical protein CVT26_012436 [Gymnopilus dilepis]